MFSQILKKRETVDLSDKETSISSQSPFGIPIYDLIDKIKRKRADDETTNKTDCTQSQGSLSVKRRKKQTVKNQLLSEKYRPREFFDLLGNDDANRHVLRWLNYWKSCVFGLPPILNDNTDRLGRPLRKVLLMNGPPGIGKTSAAHVIAQQAGFDVLEINASDERGAAVVKDRILSAVQSHQVNSKRPIIIVADEVEGASEHGFVKALSNVLNADAKALAKGTQNMPSKKAANNKNQPTLLLRPIIAICNDVWSPNLHSLRQHSEIVHYQRHPPARLLKRLEKICADEGYIYSTRRLSQLAEQYDYDLRACLNAIQFGTNDDNNRDSSAESVELADWGSLVKHQFLYKTPATFQQLESCSDTEKLVIGCFTAYPDGSYIDDMLKKPAAIGDFLALGDSRHSGDELKAFVAHAFGQLFRSPRVAAQNTTIFLSGGKSFGKPPSHYEENKRTKSIVANIIANSSVSLKASLSQWKVLTEICPFIVSISNPISRTVLDEEDKRRLHSIAHNLQQLGMRLRTEKLENGTFAHKLDPPVQLTCIFGEHARSSASHGLYITRCQIKDAMAEISKRTSMTLSTRQGTGNQSTSSQKPVVENKNTAKLLVDLTSFFGEPRQESTTQIQRKVEQRASKVWVQHSEGFSNAVRKSICWNELFDL